MRKDPVHPLAAAARALARKPSLEVKDLDTRGQADIAGFWARFHNPALHHGGTAMDALERARVGALGAMLYPGAGVNLTKALDGDGLYDMAFAVLTHHTYPSQNTAILDLVRAHLSTLDLWDQRAYALAAKALLADLGITEEEEKESQNAQEEEHSTTTRTQEHIQSGGETPQESQDSLSAGVGAAGSLHAHGYHIYTKTYDRIVRPSDLVGPAELAFLRAHMDTTIAPYRPKIARLSTRLARLLAAKPLTHWAFDQEEGTLDSNRFARLIARPICAPSIFKQERSERGRDTVVSLLLDNSGSMRGQPIALAATTAELMASALERVGIATEILGFTTGAWKGGQARADWLAAGAPPNPGRLNETLHIIYKPATTPWRRARSGFALMLKEGILKENIDGEALAWAHGRLLRRPETRRVLIMISDGAPVDDATMAANGPGYLESDLAAVVAAIGTRKAVQLAAIGIGHDVSRHYPNATTIRDVNDLAGALAQALEDLLVI